MKKSLFTSLFAPLALGFVLVFAMLAGPTLTATAQSYYGNYSNYSGAAPYNGCAYLTVYQGLWSTDSSTSGQVTMLQVFLNQAGYLSGVSGTFDNGTYGAVINYQRAYGLPVTGVLDPATRALISQQSCGAGVSGGYPGSYQNSYPVTNYLNGNNCYWTGGTYNNMYVCTNTPVSPMVPPVYPYQPYQQGFCNGYNNYRYQYGNSYCNPYAAIINSLSVSYSYTGSTITITGSGFSPTGNTVYFGNTIISSNAVSNGSTIVFTVPAGYYAGTYGVSVKNSFGYSSNTLSLDLTNNYNNCNYNNGNWYSNNNCYNNVYQNGNYYVNPPSLSNITGPSTVQAGVSNTWNVTSYVANNSYNGYNNMLTLTANWGDVYNSGNNTQTSYANGNQNFSFSHMYQNPGTYTLRITATDNSGRSTYETYTVVVTGNGNYYYHY